MNGFCAPNIVTKDAAGHIVAPPFTDNDLAIIQAGKFESAKLMPYHSLAHINQLREVGVTHAIQRFPELAVGEKFLDHSRACLEVIRASYPAVRTFQTGNEPNDVNAWGAQGWQYQFYMRYVMRDIQLWCTQNGIAYGKDIEFILPPLSYAPALWHSLGLWEQAFTQRPDKDKRVPALSEYHQYAGANCYWQYPKFMLDGSYGMSWQDVHNWSGLPVHVLEYGYTAYLVGVPEETIEKQMMLDYPSYIKQTEIRTNPGPALSAHVFLVGGTDDWSGLSISKRVAQAIAAGEARAAKGAKP